MQNVQCAAFGVSSSFYFICIVSAFVFMCVFGRLHSFSFSQVMFFSYRFLHHLYSFALYCLIFMEILCECFQFSDSLTVNVLRVRNLLRANLRYWERECVVVWQQNSKQLCRCFSIDMQQNILLKQDWKTKKKLAVWSNVTKMHSMQQRLGTERERERERELFGLWHYDVYKNRCGHEYIGFLTWFELQNLHSTASKIVRSIK